MTREKQIEMEEVKRAKGVKSSTQIIIGIGGVKVNEYKSSDDMRGDQARYVNVRMGVIS